MNQITDTVHIYNIYTYIIINTIITIVTLITRLWNSIATNTNYQWYIDTHQSCTEYTVYYHAHGVE